ncbi:endopeptidase La [Desulfomonile tiedjei]|uniref:endopeptidase La n=1 Tax=Desulfomonile tiedjei (strain ATCC 49306 / DSM 6799 / DCB-1) TaxID=706587 RepID=I4C1K2_DESTA|nr:endopeptidase La [Desulfomonile tiedjei]AFM23443.1 ATP-dependent protease La [Desulfomonile tiedjei DSM 6799]
MAFFRKSQEDEKPSVPQEILDLRAGIDKARLPDHVRPAAQKELERLERTDPSLPEYIIGLTYLDYLLSLPWNRYTDDNLDLQRAEQILERQHYGLHHAKQRVLEFLAVRTLRSHRKFRILIVDDEEMARSNMEHVISKEGYEVQTAANGLEALHRLQSETFDLVITDLKMEKLDGMELLQSAKQSSTPPEIILVTGYATVDSAVDAFSKGAAHYLIKPYKLDDLRSIVNRTLDKKRHAQFTRGPILCFAGAPGTGKTSIGQAIAESMQRKFARISLAGLRDEAELRGHRRTYVGAMPGRIISEIKNLNLKNPVLMLDEIDKIGQDFKGDPASVLLEILDPEQNHGFRDHYLDVPFDLSAVMFIATANVVDNLPSALLDRLEVIQFPGYTEAEKMEISERFLIPRQLSDCGLSDRDITFEDDAITTIIRDYTREAGLRNLEREIANVCRRLAFLHLLQGDRNTPAIVNSGMVAEFLGPRKYRHEIAEAKDRIGIATGLVWTEFGGEIIFVEAVRMRGSQQLILTGSLGDILRESAQTALSYIRSNAEALGIDPDFFHNSDIHVHIPAGAIPKDGPSAGITICMALISLLTSRPAKRDIAMSGEITLSGRILPVSGIREKLLAAQRAGIKTVIFPARNQADVESCSSEITKNIKVVLAEEMIEIVDLVLPVI